MTMRIDWKRGCFWGFVAFAFSAPLIFFWLRASTRPSEALPWFAFGAGGSLAIVGLNAIIAVDVVRQRRLLDAGGWPVEGEWGAFTGVLECARPLRGPISGAAVALYAYLVTQSKPSSMSGPTQSTYFNGYAMAPSSLRTQFGSMPLTEIPVTAIQSTDVPHEQAVRHFLSYKEVTAFTLAPTAGGSSEPEQNPFRRDIQVWTTDPEWDRATLTEISVFPGEEVVIYGSRYADRGLASSQTGENPILYRRNEVRADLSKNFRDSMSSVVFFTLIAIGAVTGYQIYFG